jgi:hypothetical protein
MTSLNEYHRNALTDALARIARSPFATCSSEAIAEQRTAIVGRLRDAVLSAIPAFSSTNNPDILPDLARHGLQHTDEILRLVSD